MSTTGPRRVAGGVAIALLLVGAAALVVRWWTFDPEPDLRALTGKIGAPSGYELARSRWIGDRPAKCDVSPACETGRLSIEWTSAAPGTDPCSAMFDVLDKWVEVGFDTKAVKKADDLNTCSVDGELEGHPASSQVLSTAGRDGPLSTIVLNVRW